MKNKITRFCRMNFFVELPGASPHGAQAVRGTLNLIIRKTCANATPVIMSDNPISGYSMRWYSEPLPANDVRRIAYGVWGELISSGISPKHFRIETVIGGWPCVDDDDEAVPF